MPSEKQETNLDKSIKLGCVKAALSEHLSKKLFGEVFTVIDASTINTDSRRAIKSLISQSFTRANNRIINDLENLSEEMNKDV